MDIITMQFNVNDARPIGVWLPKLPKREIASIIAPFFSGYKDKASDKELGEYLERVSKVMHDEICKSHPEWVKYPFPIDM
ncbi:hypothetical protein ABG067_003592 [Albugo candida]